MVNIEAYVKTALEIAVGPAMVSVTVSKNRKIDSGR
jgi:hypothetical protein